MSKKKANLAITAFVSALCMWLLAGLWHKVIAVQFYTRETGAQHEGTVIILIAYIILALLMVYLYGFYRIKKDSLIQAFLFGVVIGLLWVFPHELAMAGAHGESVRYVFINAAWHMVEQGVGGLVIALISKRFACW
ncbi:MAG: hypothetical protein OEY52_08205 [Gammaproteobacteria bacterium]|nr:hypothetical protein [Gammaproteobacteria bacterium]